MTEQEIFKEIHEVEVEEEALFRHIYCYGPIVFSMLFGIWSRVVYLEFNPNEFEEKDKEKDDDLEDHVSLNFRL